MKHLIKYSIALLLAFAITSAALSQDVVSLTKGQEAPYAGLLFTEIKANEIRQELIQKDSLVKLVASYERSVNLQDLNFKLSQEQVVILQSQNDLLMKQVSYSDYQKYMWLGLGVIGTSLAVYGAGALR